MKAIIFVVAVVRFLVRMCLRIAVLVVICLPTWLLVYFDICSGIAAGITGAGFWILVVWMWSEGEVVFVDVVHWYNKRSGR